MVTIINDINLIDHVEEYDAIIVGVGIYGVMKDGFMGDIAKRYKKVLETNINTRYADPNKLGTIIECNEYTKPKFILAFIVKGNYRPDLKSDYLEYDSLDKCLRIINILYKGQKLACPLLGNSRFDGNGDREKIIEIFKKAIIGTNIDIYDFEQKSRDEKFVEQRAKELEVKKVDLKKYYEIVKQRKENEKKLIK